MTGAGGQRRLRAIGGLFGVMGLVVVAVQAAALTATPTASPVTCAGDCDASGAVVVSELIQCVGLASGAPVGPCAGCDADGDGAVTIAELVAGVNALLTGCPVGDAYEPDNSRAAARHIACGEQQGRDLATPGDQDWVRFDLPAGQGGVIETVSTGQGLWDTTLTLYNPGGALLAYDDNGGEGDFSRLAFGCSGVATAATYSVRAAQAGGAALGGYGIRITCGPCPTETPTQTPTPTGPPDAFEPDDSLAQASAIACGEVQRHTAPYADVDWATLTLSGRSTVHLRLATHSGYAGLVVRDEAGETVFSDYFDGHFECGRNPLPAGRYHLRVSGDFSVHTAYDLGVLCAPCERDNATPTPTYTRLPTPTPLPPDDYETDDRDSAPPISCGQGLIRSLSSRDDSDWLWLQVQERSAVTIQTTSPFSAPMLALQNMDGDDIGFGYGIIDRDCTAPLDAGSYFVEAYQGDAAFPYDMWVSCTPCGAAGGPTPIVTTRTPTPTAPPRDAYEPDDSPGDARDIGCGELQTRSLHARHDADWVSFTLAETSAISAAISPDLLLYLYDGAGETYLTSAYRVLDRTCGDLALAPGRYQLQVPSTNFAVPSYNLSLLCEPCAETPTPTPSRTPSPTRRPGGPIDGPRVFALDPGVLLADPSSPGSGFFTTGLSGASAANGPDDGFSGGPLRLIVGNPDATGVAALRLSEDATLRIGLLDGTYACLTLDAFDSDGSIDCDGGTPYGTAGVQPPGNVGAPFDIQTGLGPPLGPGHANLLVRGRYQVVAFGSPDYGRTCAAVTYHDPEQLFAFTTATASAEKGALRLAVDGQPFDCPAFHLPCSGGELVAPLPGSIAPIGDLASAIRVAEAGCADEQRAR